MTVVIRPRVEEDIQALADVLVRVHAQDGYPVEGVADPVAWLCSDRMLSSWVAELDGEVVGQVMLAEPGDGDAATKIEEQRSGLSGEEISVLGRLFVDPSARGKRIAGNLINAAVDYSEAVGRIPVLDVMAKDRAAIALYERMGWEKIGTFEHVFRGGSVPALAYRYATGKRPRGW
ncbi:GNAT family N-acetyltransferase [Luteococcus sp. OSA5]|uniref:GNAT family N-acetyltransferase n=1 Tax=Luteococcus sp. OSA5 TaxID=3401630 RepID=UPI003B438B65